MDAYLIYKKIEKSVDRDGHYTIKLSRNLNLKGTKEEIKLLIANLQKAIAD